jgi:hypothetical protein
MLETIGLDELGLEAGQVASRQPVRTVRQQAGQPQGNRVRHQLCHTLFNVVDVLPKIDLYYNYLCTYDLYGPVRNAFDAGSIHYEGKARPWKSIVF